MSFPPELLHVPDAEPVIIKTSFGWAKVLTNAAQIPTELRDRAFAHTGKDLRFYSVTEDTLSGQFEQRYFLLEHEATGRAAIQPWFFVEQDITAGLPAGLRQRLVAPLRRGWPQFLKLRIMMVGCTAGEGQLDHFEPWVAQALHETLDLFAPQSGASVILLKDFPSNYREPLGVFARNGYQRVPSLPSATLDLDFPSFEHYMQTRLSKVYRKNLRRKFKALQEAAPLEMEVLTDATPVVEEIYALHLQTFRRSDFHFEELTPEFFRLIGQRMPERIRFFLWRQEGRLVAFSLCLLHDGILYDLDVGLDYSIALDLHLYFVTWRGIIEWGLKNGVRMYHTGPLNYDPKLHLRLKLAPQDLYARHTSPLLNPFFKLAIKFLEPAQHDPTLKQFENAHEMMC